MWWTQCFQMTRPALRSVGTPHVKELINQRHILSRNVSDLLTSAPLWLWLECLDHPPQLGFGWRALKDIGKRMRGGTQHMWCCLDIAKHIRLARTRFFTLSRLSMVADWGRIFAIRGDGLPRKAHVLDICLQANGATHSLEYSNDRRAHASTIVWGFSSAVPSKESRTGVESLGSEVVSCQLSPRTGHMSTSQRFNSLGRILN